MGGPDRRVTLGQSRAAAAPKSGVGTRPPESRMGATTLVAAALASVLLVLAAVGSAGSVAAQTGTLDPSDVVLVFDFSNSILLSKSTNQEFARALNNIADRV